MSKHLEVPFKLRAKLLCRLYLYPKRVHRGTGVVGIYDYLTANFVFDYKERLGAFKTFSQRSAINKSIKRKTVYFL